MNRLRCSFCGKDQDDVKKLVAGANALICNECIAVADKLMKDKSTSKPPAWPQPPKPPRR